MPLGTGDTRCSDPTRPRGVAWQSRGPRRRPGFEGSRGYTHGSVSSTPAPGTRFPLWNSTLGGFVAAPRCRPRNPESSPGAVPFSLKGQAHTGQDSESAFRMEVRRGHVAAPADLRDAPFLLPLAELGGGRGRPLQPGEPGFEFQFCLRAVHCLMHQRQVPSLRSSVFPPVK